MKSDFIFKLQYEGLEQTVPSGPSVYSVYAKSADGPKFLLYIQDQKNGCFSRHLADALQIKVCVRKFFYLFLNQTYVVGTHRNRLDETVLLSTKTYV